LTLHARKWAPPGFVTAVRIEDAARAMILNWQSDWCVKKEPEISIAVGAMVWHAVVDPAPPGREDVGIRLIEAGTPALLKLLIGSPVHDEQLSATDADVLGYLTNEATQDLGARFKAATSNTIGQVRQSVEAEPAYKLTISADGSDVFEVLLSGEACIRLCRAVLGSARRRKPMPALAQAFNHIPVAVSGWLGETEIGLADAQSLNIGDVVVLSTKVSSSFEVRLVGSTAAIARGTLADHPGCNAIRITAEEPQ